MSHKSKYTKSRRSVQSQNNPDEKSIDLSEAKPAVQHIGPCEGCGIPDAQKRFVTNEFLCPNCRNDLRYKLITKSTVMGLYPSITHSDLKEAVMTKKIHCFRKVNWYNRNAPPIHLYYQNEIMSLAKFKEKRPSSRQHESSRSHHQHGSSRSHQHGSSRSHHHHGSSRNAKPTLQIEKI